MACAAHPLHKMGGVEILILLADWHKKLTPLSVRNTPSRYVRSDTIAIGNEQRIVCVTDKLTTHGPYFVELGHTVPSSLSIGDIESISIAALDACKALGLNYGACHTEVKLTPRGPVVIEVNPRLGGDCIVDLVDISLGINLYELIGRMSLGERLSYSDLTPKRNRGASIRFYPSPGGKLVHATSPLFTNMPDNLIEFSITTALGCNMPNADSNQGRIAYAISAGSTGQEAAENSDLAIKSLEIINN